ncbi:MAG: sensor histidine kinase [Eggerthellales bacterium]|nr:sensor histidine kinase [Eggerthellales bacterium]
MSPFTLGSFLQDRWPVLALGAAGSAFLALMASVLGVNTAGSVVMGAFFALIVIAMLTWEYLRRKRFYAELCAALEGMEHAYYLTSLLRRPRFQDGQLLFDACSAIVAADGADLAREREAAAGNREFAELWTHEIKTPLAAARLTLERMHGPDALALRRELDRISLACERVLYSARTSNLSADYAIRPVDLAAVCKDACKELATLLIERGVAPRFQVDSQVQVLSDEPWVRFVLKQLLTNAAKYGASTVTFSSCLLDPNTPAGRTELMVEDNGCGIPESELGRVFDRGFSGSNGRAEGTSTGMGLYLAAQACAAMGIGLRIQSVVGEGTCVTLTFPHDRSRAKVTAS